MNENQKIFVIIVTYKGRQWYDKCFNSLRESTVPVKTIVVDNTPGEEDANYIRDYFPEIILLKPEHNLGFGKGNNLAMKYAREHEADYVFLLNQDTWLCDKDVIKHLINVSLNNPEYGILSPLHMKADGVTIGMQWEDGNNYCSRVLLPDVYKQDLKDVYSTNYINAAAWLLPRKTLDVVGGFTPMFEHYEEDDDYLNRTLYHGLKVGLCPKWKIIHDHKSSENPFEKDRNKYHRQQELLVRLLDVRQKNAPHRILRYYLRKYIQCIVSGKIKQSKFLMEDIKFIIKNRKGIACTRQQNKKAESSWL